MPEPTPTAPSGRGKTLEELLMAPHVQLCGVEKLVIDNVKESLELLAAGGNLTASSSSASAHDAAFSAYAAYVKHAGELVMPLRAARLWIADIEPLVLDFEKRHSIRLHKGAPIYNTGLCFFWAGDFIRTTQYIEAAGQENELTHGGESRLHVAEDLARTVLLAPYLPWLQGEVGNDYSAATGRTLDEDEVVKLVGFLARRDEDAVLFLFALHRLASQQTEPSTRSTRLHRVRALGDLLLIYESSLRRWQKPKTKLRELFDRSEKLVAKNPLVKKEFDLLHARYPAKKRKSVKALNACIGKVFTRFDSHAAKARRPAAAGDAGFLSYALRNALLHEIDSSLAIFSDRALLMRCVACALVSLRLSRFGQEGTMRWIR